MYATLNSFVYPKQLTEALYCRYIGEICTYYAPTFHAYFDCVKGFNETSKLTLAAISAVLQDAYGAIASVYRENPERGAALLVDLVKPVNTDIASMFARVAMGLQTHVNILRYADQSMTNDETRHAMVAILFVLSKYADFRGPVTEACADMLGSAEQRFDTHLDQQRYLAREFFGQGWEYLYADEEMSAADVVRNVLLLRPPFVQDSSPPTFVELPPGMIS